MNAFGLSNTAWRTAALAAALPVPADASLVDRYLAVRAASQGARLAVDPRVGMQVRQHGANLARMAPPFEAGRVLRAADLVLAHCRLVLAPAAEVAGDLGGAIRTRADQVRRFREAMAAHPDRLPDYVRP